MTKESDTLVDARPIAALYITKGGAYYGLDGVDPWDAERDARLYDGPHPVVAHPPCARWSVPLAYVNQTRYGYKVGDDDGCCFEHALWAVRTFGGVLEHPRDSIAWDRFGLPKPKRGRWTQSLLDPGFSTVVDQWAYGHPAKKQTWLYAVGVELVDLDWRVAPVGQTALVSWLNPQAGRKRITKDEASRTPETFRDELIAMARSARVTKSVAA